MSYENSFKGKTVIVTGGGRGLGRELCVKLHKLGAKVYAVARSPDNLKTLEEECPGLKTVAVDLSNWEATREAIDKIEAVDMLVNNAGIFPQASFFDVTEKIMDDISDINVKAVINVSQVVTKKMIAAKKAGSIVNVSSIVGLKPFPSSVAYSVSKAGLDHLTKIMAVVLGPSNIRVNSVNPGPLKTETLMAYVNSGIMNEEQKANWEALNKRTVTNQKMNELGEVVSAILFLLSDAAPMITGALLPLEGGLAIS